MRNTSFQHEAMFFLYIETKLRSIEKSLLHTHSPVLLRLLSICEKLVFVWYQRLRLQHVLIWLRFSWVLLMVAVAQYESTLSSTSNCKRRSINEFLSEVSEFLLISASLTKRSWSVISWSTIFQLASTSSKSKINNRNTNKICSKLTPEWRHWHCLMFLLLTLKKFHTFL